VCVCVCVCVHWKKLNPGNPDPIFSKHNISILDTVETQHVTSFAGRGHWLGIHVSCLARRSVARNEDVYEWVWVRRLSFNSRHLVLARITTPQKSYKILEDAVSDTLLMSGFWIFAADALHDFFSRTNQNKCSIITRFLPAAHNLVDVNYDTVQHNRHMYVHDVCFLAI